MNICSINNTSSRILPFAVFMTGIGFEELLRFFGDQGLLSIPTHFFLYLYPIRAVAVGVLLIALWRRYDEIRFSDLLNYKNTLLTLVLGVLVFILWINMDWSWATIGSPKGYDPTLLSDFFTRNFLIGMRLLGAAVLVPVMEELFWRSWLLRYLISQDFHAVAVGKFTLASFLIGSVLFGLEHNLWLAGFMAGAAYTLLLYRTKSLVQCVLAHSITNLLLGSYVLQAGRWEYW